MQELSLAGKSHLNCIVLFSHMMRSHRRTSPLLRSEDVEGVLKQDYVLVDDTRAVEFNRVADGKLATLPDNMRAMLIFHMRPQKSKPRGESLQ